jgi:hypothetical protein
LQPQLVNTFPILSCGSPVLYPLTRSINFLTTVHSFLNDKTQRWRSHDRLESFDLVWNHLKLVDLNAILTFWRQMRGPDHTDWEITIDGQLYQNCTFMDDSLSYTEEDAYPELYSLQLSARQVVQNAPRVASPPGPFPTFRDGIRFQRPYACSFAFRTLSNEMPWSGQKITHADRTQPTNCNPPHVEMGSWSLQYPCLTPPEALSLETHFLNAQGRYASFEFTDPVGTIHTKVCYGMDNLRWQYPGPGAVQTTVILQEIR